MGLSTKLSLVVFIVCAVLHLMGYNVPVGYTITAGVVLVVCVWLDILLPNNYSK